MNQNIIIADDFYDIAHKYHKGILEGKLVFTEEIPNKISYLLGRKVKVENLFNQSDLANTFNPITSNLACDWIAVVYLTLPAECISKKGMSFYSHVRTGLDSFPDEYTLQLHGLKTHDEIVSTFDVKKKEDWKEYSSVYVKYNRIVLFNARLWHSYGNGFGEQINNSMIYQKMLIKNA
jgi:hypothetical protein|tara:strand:- start:76 stop:609 length:534 start_codon:yes stop_codon:yes gene_type:complete